MRAHRTGLAVLCAALMTGVVATHSAPAAAAPAAAGPSKATKKAAKTAFLGARKKFKAGDYAGALVGYQKAESLIPGLKPKFKIAECYDKLGKAEEAVAAYRVFIDDGRKRTYDTKNPKQAKKKKALDKMMATAMGRLGALEATLPANVTVQLSPPGVQGAQVTVDGKPQQGLALKMAAGEHTIGVTASGYQPLQQRITVRGGEKRQLPLTLAPAAAGPVPPGPAGPVPGPVPPPPEDEDEGGRSNVPAYVTLGIAGAGAILGTAFGIMALGSKSDFDENPTVEAADEAERNALISDMSFGVALTFGITGAVLLFTGGGDDDDEEDKAAATKLLKPKLRPMVGTKGGAMSATWTF